MVRILSEFRIWKWIGFGSTRDLFSSIRFTIFNPVLGSYLRWGFASGSTIEKFSGLELILLEEFTIRPDLDPDPINSGSVKASLTWTTAGRGETLLVRLAGTVTSGWASAATLLIAAANIFFPPPTAAPTALLRPPVALDRFFLTGDSFFRTGCFPRKPEKAESSLDKVGLFLIQKFPVSFWKLELSWLKSSIAKRVFILKADF